MRSFLPSLALALPLLFSFGTGPAPASEAAQMRVGISAPLSGNFAILGNQLRAGAVAAARQSELKTAIVDDRCTAEGGAEAARRLLEQGVAIVIGFLCSDAIEAALPPLSKSGIILITPGVRATGFTDQRTRNGWLVYRTAPRADQEQHAIGNFLIPLWRGLPFAILDDGTLYGHGLAENFRFAAETAGLRPALITAFRPGLDSQAALAAQLQEQGIAHAFVGGQAEDIARIAADAAALGHEIVLAGGEALRGAPELPEIPAGTLMVGLPEAEDLAGPELDRALESGEIASTGYALAGFATMEVAIAALEMRHHTGRDLRDILDSQSFKTAAGMLEFDEKGDLAVDPYRLFRYDGTRFVRINP